MSSLLITAVTILKPAACGTGDARTLTPAPRALFGQDNAEQHAGRLPRVRRS